MAIIARADGYAVDQLPIELIETGDTVLAHHADGTPFMFVVEIKRFEIDKVAGTSTVGLQAAADTAMELGEPVATVEAPIGTLGHRIIPDSDSA